MDASTPDLDACSREPIHIPGSIQPHGVLLALGGPERTVLYVSANAGAVLAVPAAEAPGRPLAAVAGPALAAIPAEILRAEPEAGAGAVQAGAVDTPAGAFQVIVHAAGPLTVVELERTPAGDEDRLDRLYPRVRSAIEELEGLTDPAAVAAVAARRVRGLTGFDRVLIYRFDADGNGTVVGEDGNGRLPSYLDLRFPASDIPAQARALYLLNRLRLIPDAGYAPVPLLAAPGPATAAPLDLSRSVLRSVSPVHVAYMRAMGTAASMSVSIVAGGRLWGLISCHHAEPRHVSFAVRTACDLLGQVLSVRIAAGEERAGAEARLRLGAVRARLITALAQADSFPGGLADRPDDLLALTGAEGAAVVAGEDCRLIGRTPPEETVRALAARLTAEDAEEERDGDGVFATAALPALWPEFAGCRDTAAGLLAVALPGLRAGRLLWFRPEVVRTVRWAGDPRKPVEAGAPGRPLGPRHSFAAWRETVRDRALPWAEAEREAAAELRRAVVGIVLRRAEELAALNAELRRSNRELEAFSYSVSHDLRAPFRHIVGFAELLREREAERLTDTGRRYLATIVDAANTAGTLVDNLLQFSQMGRSELAPVDVDMAALVAEVRATLAPEAAGRTVVWEVPALPVVRGDPVMLRMVWQNLLGNALKYTRTRDPARITVTRETADGEAVFCVRDNGVGFDQAYVGKLFGVFQRLHRVEEFEGVGIGLANVRRAVERHGGRTRAEGAPDRGAAFYFTLPAAALRS
ncbi:ATP-binding protein [Azospirillum halopraeferens]|uniref:ATP-binding protein n=1 Tax=Azospirillum halopraeferens TaxID=34010 RepID=UPI000414CDD2|nr:ATP-binding protein [Azospirillum halopraeferens]